MIRFSVWLVSCYAHVFLQLSVVIVTLPPKYSEINEAAKMPSNTGPPKISGEMATHAVGTADLRQATLQQLQQLRLHCGFVDVAS